MKNVIVSFEGFCYGIIPFSALCFMMIRNGVGGINVDL